MEGPADYEVDPKYVYTAPEVGFVPPGYSSFCDQNWRSRLFFHFINVVRIVCSWSTLISLILSGGCLVLCRYLDAYARIHPNLFITVLVFPLAFSINAVYQRRERALDDIGALRTACITWFFHHEEWADKLADPAVLEKNPPPEEHERWRAHNAEYGQWHLEETYVTLKELLNNVRDYLSTPDIYYGMATNQHLRRKDRILSRNKELAAIYVSLRAISACNERLRMASVAAASSVVKNPFFVQPPILTRPIHWTFFIVQAFEKLRGIREYRSPTTIRSFTKTLSWLVPMLLAPYFSWIAEDYQEWAAYFTCFFVTVTFNSLRVVQDFGENPFLPVGQHDIDNINLRDLGIQWFHGAEPERRPPPVFQSTEPVA